MEFKLPRVHDIAIEIDGRRFEGSWYVILRDMIVNYNGWTASTHERTTGADEAAVEMLQDLVESTTSASMHCRTTFQHAFVMQPTNM